MAEFHLYFLRQGMLVGATSVEADNESEAERIAREQGDGEYVEIWNDHRRVRVVSPAKGPQAQPESA